VILLEYLSCPIEALIHSDCLFYWFLGGLGKNFEKNLISLSDFYNICLGADGSSE